VFFAKIGIPFYLSEAVGLHHVEWFVSTELNFFPTVQAEK